METGKVDGEPVEAEGETDTQRRPQGRQGRADVAPLPASRLSFRARGSSGRTLCPAWMGHSLNDQRMALWERWAQGREYGLGNLAASPVRWRYPPDVDLGVPNLWTCPKGTGQRVHKDAV